MNALKTVSAQKYPVADISINKQRLKKYNDDVFLEDGSNFEIELSNHTTKTWLAKFKINGSYISNTGIIIKPGVHHYLERYIDKPQKFQFSTYDVPDTPATHAAIMNNGLVEIEFYEEKEPEVEILTAGTFNDVWFGMDNSSTSGRGLLYDSTTDGDYKTYSSNVSNTSAMMDFAPSEVQSRSTMRSKSSQHTRLKKSLSMETGRVEQGGHSEQTFGISHEEFNTFVSHTVTYHLKPESQMHIRPENVKVYCTECRTKLQKKWKFCSTCGTKC